MNDTKQLGFYWDSSSPEQRNALCASYMPQGDLNPIRSWHVQAGGQLIRLAVQSLAEAEAWLRVATASPRNWERVAELPEACRLTARIVEHQRHLRYTDTPAGAWALLEQLMEEGWLVNLRAQKGTLTALTVKRGEEYHQYPGQDMAELVGKAFLVLHGVELLASVNRRVA